MPSKETAKTRLVHKLTPLLITLLLVLAVVLIFILWPKKVNSLQIKSGGKTYTVELAETTAQQEKGLGDRTSLPNNQGMLFIFGGSNIRCFWMKDMHFPLDMIWIGSNKNIQYIQPDVLPSSYPNDYCPAVNAEYVLELNAGQAKASSMYIGEKLKF